MAYLKFMGTSDSQGVPRLLCRCSVCTTRVIQNIRTRPSVYIQLKGDQILIDISPDFHQQFSCNTTAIIPQTVLITHLHNDHIAGLGDFADLCFWHNSPARIISPPDMIEGLKQRFPYLNAARKIEFVATFEIELDGWQISFHRVQHGVNGYAYAIRFQISGYVWVYMPDAFQATAVQLAPFAQADLMIMGASEWFDSADPYLHRAMYDVQEALQIKQDLYIKKLVLTHLSHSIDIPTHTCLLPLDVQFALDGMELPLPK